MPALVSAEIGSRSRSVQPSAAPRPKSRTPALSSGDLDMAKSQILDRAALTNGDNGKSKGGERMQKGKPRTESQDLKNHHHQKNKRSDEANQESHEEQAIVSATQTMENGESELDELPCPPITDAKAETDSSSMAKNVRNSTESSSLRNANSARKSSARSQTKLKDTSASKDSKIVVTSSKSKLKEAVKEKESTRLAGHKSEKLTILSQREAKTRETDQTVVELNTTKTASREAAEEEEDVEKQMQYLDKDGSFSSPQGHEEEAAKNDIVDDCENSEMGRNPRVQDPANGGQRRSTGSPLPQASSQSKRESHGSMAVRATESSPSPRRNGRSHSSTSILLLKEKEASQAASAKPETLSPASTAAIEKAPSSAATRGSSPSLKPSSTAASAKPETSSPASIAAMEKAPSSAATRGASPSLKPSSTAASPQAASAKPETSSPASIAAMEKAPSSAATRDSPSLKPSSTAASAKPEALSPASTAAMEKAPSSAATRASPSLKPSSTAASPQAASAAKTAMSSPTTSTGAMEKTPSSGTRASPSLKPSRFSEWSYKPSPMSPASTVSKAPEQGTSPEHHNHMMMMMMMKNSRRASLEGDRVRSRVKEIFSNRRKSSIGIESRRFGDSESIVSSEHTMSSVLTRDNPNLGPFLLMLAKQAITSGDNPHKALDYASRAARSFETASDGKPSLDLAMSLHILAAIHCTLGQFQEAIPVLQHSVTVPDVESGGQDHALAVFAGHMQLGDTYNFLGRSEDALAAYHCGLEVQKRALGDKDPRVGETCRYLAEAHTQAMQFDKAEELCLHALDIHKEHSAPASVEEATDRRLMGLICNSKGQFEAALEHLVLASMALISNGKDIDVASVDVSIGDTYVSLGRFDEAIFTYQKALTIFKSSKGENHVSVASVYVSLAEAYLKMGKVRESKTYCESALRIFNKQAAGHQLDEVASGLTDLAVVYESLNEQEQALSLLNKALGILESAPGQQSAIAGVEAQIGVLCYMRGNYMDARISFQKAISKLRASAEKNSALFGIVLNQMGLCCLQISEIEAAVIAFEESKAVLEANCGSHHTDTLAVYSNLAGAYDALGRLDDAINALQYVVEVRQGLGSAEPELEDEKNRLSELLNESGVLRSRRLSTNLTTLFIQHKSPIKIIPQHNVTSSVSLSMANQTYSQSIPTSVK